MPNARALGSALVTVVALLVLGGGASRGAPVDPTVPVPVFAGAPAGFAPMDRLDSARTGRSSVSLPEEPELASVLRVPSDFGVLPAIDERGRVVAATADGRVSQIDGNGRVEWFAPLDSPAAVSPVLLSDGTRVVMTERGSVVGLDRNGRAVFETHADGGLVRAPLLPTRDGAIVVAAGSSLVKLESSGTVEARYDVREPVVALVEADRGVYATTDSGDVLFWSPPNDPRRVASFGGRTSSTVVLAGANTLLAVRDNARLVAADLRTGTRSEQGTAAPDEFAGPPTMTGSGEVLLGVRGGLVRYRGSHEVSRIPLGLGGGPGLPRPSLPAPPLTDARGFTAVAVAPGTLFVIHPTNDVRNLSLEGCTFPLGVLPEGPGRLAVVCRSGLLAIVKDRPRHRTHSAPDAGPP
jgi:hypothetical protein